MAWIAAMPGQGFAATDLMQKAGIAGCITETGAGGCQDGRGLVGPAAIDLSSDGKSAYVASSSWNSVSVLSFDSASGQLVPQDDLNGCFHSFEVVYPACTSVRQLGGAEDLAVSHDGKSVYVASYSDNAIVVFDRDTETGALSLSAAEDGCVNATGSDDCKSARGIQGPQAVVVSPDDESVYVGASGAGGGIATFDRDIAGDLHQKAGEDGCFNPGGAEGCRNAPALLLDTRGLAISPDGESVYAGSRTHAVVTSYDRDAEGVLTMKPGSAGCVNEAGDNGCQDGTALIDPDAIVLSADGANLYVAASRSDAIAIFDRIEASGGLSQKPGTAGCISNTGASDPMQASTVGACADGLAMDEADSMAVSPDGDALYATAAKSSGVLNFERHADGTLTQRPGRGGCTTDSGYEDPALSWTAGYCEDGRALLKASDVAVAQDSGHVFTTAREGGVGIFDVVPPPVAAPAILPQPPAAAPKPVNRACRRARRRVRRIEHRLTRIRRGLHREARRARRAKTRRSRNRHASRARRARRQLNRMTVKGRMARRRMRKVCQR